MHKHPSIDQTTFSTLGIPTLKKAFKDIWKTPNLLLITATNCLEWIDMFVFIHCASLFAVVFAPQELQDKLAKIFIYLLYIIPPLSAILFGFLADKFGRRFSLMITAFGIVILTCLLAITPSYKDIGIFSFIIFMTVRVLMSFVVSGENVLAGIYAFESAHTYEDTSLLIPLVDTGEAIAGLFILLVSSILLSFGGIFSEEYIARILLIVIVCCFIFIMSCRQRLHESRQFLVERDMVPNATLGKNYYVSLKKILQDNQDRKIIKNAIFYGLSMFLYPLGFVISYVYTQDLLKTELGYTTAEVFNHNLFVIFGELCCLVLSSLLAWSLETKKILSRKFSTLALVCIVPTMGSVYLYYYLSHMIVFNPYVLMACQISILCVWPSVIGGQFFVQFPILGRSRLAMLSWGFSCLIKVFTVIALMDYLKDQGGYNYFFVFFGTLIIHIVCIYFSQEPTKAQRLYGFNGRTHLENHVYKSRMKNEYNIIV